MNFRAGHEWIVYSFDEDGRLRDRRVGFGSFGQVGMDSMQAADSQINGFGLGAGLIISPHLFPSEVKPTICDALSLKLPDSLCRAIAPHYRGAWCARLSEGGRS